MVGELLGLPGERVAAVADAGGGPAAYLATVIVPPSGRDRVIVPPSGRDRVIVPPSGRDR